MNCPPIASRDDRKGRPVEDVDVATADVISAVGLGSADRLTLGFLVVRSWQDRAVTIADEGKFHRQDVQGGRGHDQMRYVPVQASLRAMHGRMPFAITEELDPRCLCQKVQGTFGVQTIPVTDRTA